MSRIPLNLFKGCSDAKKELLLAQYKNSKQLLLAFRKMANEKITQSYIDEEHLDDTTVIEMAKRAAYRKAYRELLSYLPDGRTDEADND